MSLLQLAFIALAGLAAGAVNALAGGGTLISFPVLMLAGLPAVSANVTNTIALCPGYLGATWAQRSDLRGQSARGYWLVPAAALGGLLGGMLLLHTGERAFTRLVPWLILLACALLAVQEPLRRAIQARATVPADQRAAPPWLPLVVMAAATYGGYFGAGMSVLVLAVLGLALGDPLPRLNALKQAVALATNGAAALWLMVHSAVNWRVVAVLAVSALLGGLCGGRLARKLSPALLRITVVLLGVAVAVVYLMRSA